MTPITRQVMGQDVIERTLDCGLHVVLLKKPGFAQQFAAFATHYGGMDAAFVVPGQNAVTHVPDGIAHFLEHKMFEQPDGSDVSQAYSQMGMSSNAYTGSYYTVYHFTTTANFAAGLNLLLDFVQTPYFTDESVAKEQGIIAQEIQTGMDSPLRVVYHNFLAAMYHHHPVRIKIAGTLESIRAINKDLLYSCHNTFYHPSNMMLIAAGDLDFAELIDLAEADMSRRNYEKRAAIQRVMPDEPETVVQPETRVEMQVSRPRVMLGFKGLLTQEKNETDHSFHRRLIAADLALAAVMGRVTPFYWRLYEQAIITDTFRFGYSAYTGAGYAWVDGESERVEQLISEVTAALNEASRNGLNKELFEAARRQEIGSILSIADDPEQMAGTFITHRFNGLEFMDSKELLDAVTPADGQAFLEQLIRDDNRVVSLVEPLKGGR